jgi:2,4-dienoyl-CoA reductase (NADPH2)
MLRTSEGPPPGRECTYCNKCLINDLENPLGCYELARYPGATFDDRYEAMLAEVMSVFDPPAFTDPPAVATPPDADHVA